MEKRRDRKGRLQTIGRRITGPAWRFLAGTLAALILMGSAVRANGQRLVYAEAADERKEEKSSTTSQLYAQSAVLMDAENGRVLLQKNGNDVMPMASTTKIMTCILTLELGNVSDMASVSSYAAGQPEVRMGAKKGEVYRIGDLLYSLMLESHNDAAVIIAEYYGSKWAGLSEDISSHSAEESKRAVLAFTGKMNEKAASLGCRDTFFVTPNGLDATLMAEYGGQTVERSHSTTARDLALIMSYCITDSPAREAFLEVTRAQSYVFGDYRKAEGGEYTAGNRTISCTNHNAFLQMMDGALSGKTGYTGKAGYCYVGALERDGKTFSIALLACGWPNNKTWKWHDARILMEYGLENFEKCDIYQEKALEPVPVVNGQKTEVPLTAEAKKIELLLGPEDEVEVEWSLPDSLGAPVKKGDEVGEQSFLVNGELYALVPVKAGETVPKITYPYCIRRVLDAVLL